MSFLCSFFYIKKEQIKMRKARVRKWDLVDIKKINYKILAEYT